jgi:octaprenyl-diphosphate synthase
MATIADKKITVDSIKAPIEEELKVFERRFKDSMKSRVPLLDRITHYIVKRKGKQMRPMFVMLASKMHGGINESTYRGAALVELLHTATLVHDDVVDNAYERRGFFSINALWKNKIAVLVGDYILSKGLLLSLENDDFHLLKIVSRAVKDMSEGELLQIEKARKLDIKEDIYFDIIRQKTATLIASACAVGAASQDISQEETDAMWQLGETIGIAFQIKDDLFDFGDDDVGKPRGIDIAEKKMTLPLIYALNQTDSSTRKEMINIVKNHNKDKKRVRELIEFVYASGGIDYARERMLEYREQALQMLHAYPQSPSRDSLEELVMYTTERRR